MVIKEDNCDEYNGEIKEIEGEKYCEIKSLTQKLVRDLASEIPLDDYGKTYFQSIGDLFSERSLRSQIPYLLNNSEIPTTDEAKLAKEQLKALSNQTPIPLSLAAENKWVLDEIEYGEIMLAFERATERKVNSGEILEMSDFQRFANRNGIPIEKVLVATDWSSDALSEEVQQKKQEYDEKMQMDWL